MLCMIDDSISFGHYAVPFELCLLMSYDLISSGHYAVPIGLHYFVIDVSIEYAKSMNDVA